MRPSKRAQDVYAGKNVKTEMTGYDVMSRMMMLDEVIRFRMYVRENIVWQDM